MLLVCVMATFFHPGRLRVRSRQNEGHDVRYVFRDKHQERAVRRGRHHLHEGCAPLHDIGQYPIGARLLAEYQRGRCAYRKNDVQRRLHRSQRHVPVHQPPDGRRNTLRYRQALYSVLYGWIARY